MDNSPKFTEPIVRSISSAAEESIYSFTKRTVFSPGTTGNCTIKFSAVTGDNGAESLSHSHAGDEIVVTVAGENTCRMAGKTFRLKRYQGLAIPPGTEHTAEVSGGGKWHGLSLYCDDCSLLHGSNGAFKVGTGVESLKTFAKRSSSLNLQKSILISPVRKESQFMELFSLSSAKQVPATAFIHKGETVYCILSGAISLSWEDNDLHLGPGMAAAIPAGYPHYLKVEDPDGCLIIAGSCSSCPLLVW